MCLGSLSVFVSISRSTICSLQPFALSPSSKDRPAFLDNFVMEELTKFVHRLCRKEEDPVGTVEVDPAELATLLQYMLIAGVCYSALWMPGQCSMYCICDSRD